MEVENAGHQVDTGPGDDSKGYIRDAKQATELEHQLTFMQGLKAYPKAVGWSLLFTGAIIMDGYDQAFIPKLFAEISFQKQFGFAYDGGYQISASWQSAIGNSSNIGTIIGIFLNGYLTERFGKKKNITGYLHCSDWIHFYSFFCTLLGSLICRGAFNRHLSWDL